MTIFKQIPGKLRLLSQKTLKKILLVTAFLIVWFNVKAQYNYSEWGIGLNYGTNKPYSNVAQNDTQRGGSLNLYYNYSPYVPFALEVLTGKLTGGNIVTDPSHRFFVNQYLGINIHGDLQLGEITEFQDNFALQCLKGLYVGTGVGIMFDNIVSNERVSIVDPTYIYPGQDHSLTPLIPVRFGYEFKIFNADDEPFLTINFCYAHYFTFAEGLDGYNDPSNKFKNYTQDMFRTITVGFKFNFGNSVAYTKPIH